MNDLQICKIDPLVGPVWDRTLEENMYNFLHSEDKTFWVSYNEIFVRSMCGSRIETIQCETDLKPITELVNLHGQVLFIGNGKSFLFYNYVRKELLKHEFDFEYVAASWSPDHNTVAVVKKDGVVATFAFSEDGRYIGMLGKNILTAEGPENKYINLGWGSESTQFKGKAKAREVVPEEKPKLHIVDSGPPTIVWSQKSEMFIVNFHVEDDKRTFKIFSNECKYLYEGPKVEGLQSVVAWKPPQSIVAFPVAKLNEINICLYEKLGPIRDQFTLRYNVPVVKMQWSHDAIFLAIMQKDNKNSIINIYMQKTGKWYLKQCLKFKESNVALNFCFINTISNLLYPIAVLTLDGIYIYTFKLGFNSTPITATKKNLTACAITDGNLLEISVYNESVVPPSMGQCKVEVPNPISYVSFHPEAWKVCLVDCEDIYYIFDYSEHSQQIERTGVIKNQIGLPFSILKRLWTCNPYSDLSKNDDFIGYSTYVHDSTLKFILSYNSVFIKNEMEEVIARMVYEQPPVKVEVIKVDGVLYIFSLLANKKLLIGNQVISNHVSSFVIHNKYLHYTNEAKNELVSIILSSKSTKKMVENNLEAKYYNGRQVEPGALVVTGIPNTSEVILQMLRGNLETIKINIILIDIIEKELKNNNWLAAYDHIRMQKMNNNILIDLDVDRFLCNVNNIIESLKSPIILNGIIEDLTDNSVLIDSYYQYCIEEFPKTISNKVRRVCEAIIVNIVKSPSFSNFISSVVVACIIGKGKAGLPEAFKYISLLHYADGDNIKTQKTIRKVIAFLSNYFTDGELFKQALGTYNLGLVSLTADAVNIDPQEYKKFFQALDQMDELSKRFEISKYLQKWSLGLSYLLRMDQSTEIVNDYIVENKLYDIAYEQLRPGHSLYKTMNLTYADILDKRGIVDRLFSLYVRMDNFNKAYSCARRQYQYWTKALLSLEKVDIDEGKENIIEDLEKYNHFYEASVVYEKYLREHDKALDSLIKAHKIREAIEFGKMIFPKNVIDEKLIPAAEVHMFKLQTTINDRKTEFLKYYDRLTILRFERAVNVDETGVYINEEDDNSSLYADSSLASSRSSRQTHTTSRQRRKQERKLFSTKEGSKYEDIGLLRTLYSLMDVIFKLQGDVKDVILALMSYDVHSHFDKCKKLHDSLYELHLKAVEAIDKIWPEDFINPTIESLEADIIAAKVNLELATDTYIQPPVDLDTIWKIGLFNKP